MIFFFLRYKSTSLTRRKTPLRNFRAVAKRKPEEKIQVWTGFEPMTSAMPVQCSTMQLSYQANWELVILWVHKWRVNKWISECMSVMSKGTHLTLFLTMLLCLASSSSRMELFILFSARGFQCRFDTSLQVFSSLFLLGSFLSSSRYSLA